MTDAQRDQISLLLTDLRDRAEVDMKSGVGALFARHSARGILRSEMTIQAGAKEIEERLSAFINTAVELVKPVAMSAEAFAMVADSAELLILSSKPETDKIIGMAQGLPRGAPSDTATSRAGQALFNEVNVRVRRHLELQRFEFAKPDWQVKAYGSQPSTAPRANRGGRPPAEFWDDLWSFIAASLYGGALNPKNQADIERAMTSWIEDRGHSAAPSTVRARARRLWDAIAVIDDT